MATFSLRLGANTDHAHELLNDTGFTTNTNTVIADSGTDTTNSYIAGFRFDPVTIAQGSTISAATITIDPKSTAQDDVNVAIHAEDVDDSATWAANGDVVNRARTTASVAWVADTLGIAPVASPSIVTVIQEIVDRGSWASGNALTILFVGNQDGVKVLRPETFGSNAATAPILDITYTEPAAGGDGRVGKTMRLHQGLNVGL